MKRAQASMEFVVLTSFMLLFFIAASIGIQDRVLSAHYERNGDVAKQLATLINNEVILAEAVNEGYSRDFYLPVLIDGGNYSLSRDPTDPQDVIINFRGQSYLFFLDGDAPISPLGPGLNTITN